MQRDEDDDEKDSNESKEKPADTLRIKQCKQVEQSPAPTTKSKPDSARFLSPLKRERVISNAYPDQIERATGIVIRPSRLKQKL